MTNETKAMLLWAAAAIALIVCFVRALSMQDEPPHKYPAPLVTWAHNMNGRIDGAQCETAGDAMVCDVRIDGGTWAKVNCAGQKCWLQWTQDSCKK